MTEALQALRERQVGVQEEQLAFEREQAGEERQRFAEALRREEEARRTLAAEIAEAQDTDPQQLAALPLDVLVSRVEAIQDRKERERVRAKMVTSLAGVQGEVFRAAGVETPAGLRIDADDTIEEARAKLSASGTVQTLRAARQPPDPRERAAEIVAEMRPILLLFQQFVDGTPELRARLISGDEGAQRAALDAFERAHPGLGTRLLLLQQELGEINRQLAGVGEQPVQLPQFEPRAAEAGPERSPLLGPEGAPADVQFGVPGAEPEPEPQQPPRVEQLRRAFFGEEPVPEPGQEQLISEIFGAPDEQPVQLPRPPGTRTFTELSEPERQQAVQDLQALAAEQPDAFEAVAPILAEHGFPVEELRTPAAPLGPLVAPQAPGGGGPFDLLGLAGGLPEQAPAAPPPVSPPGVVPQPEAAGAPGAAPQQLSVGQPGVESPFALGEAFPAPSPAPAQPPIDAGGLLSPAPEAPVSPGPDLARLHGATSALEAVEAARALRRQGVSSEMIANATPERFRAVVKAQLPIGRF